MQKKKILIAGIFLGLIVGFIGIVNRYPLLRNTLTSLSPGTNKAVKPPINIE